MDTVLTAAELLDLLKEAPSKPWGLEWGLDRSRMGSRLSLLALARQVRAAAAAVARAPATS